MGRNLPGGRLTGRMGQEVTESQWLPILSQAPQLVKKGALLPAATAVVAAMLLYANADRPGIFLWIVAVFMALAGVYAVYRIGGKPVSIPVLGAAALITGLLSYSQKICNVWAWLFGHWFVAAPDLEHPAASVITRLVQFFFWAGLPEELMKALPVFLGVWIWYKAAGSFKQRAGVQEPLDGILIAVASATAFALVETMRVYVPAAMLSVQKASYEVFNQTIGPNVVGQENLKHAADAWKELTSVAGFYAGLATLTTRLISNIAGHVAYSGMFGYYIGLSVMKTKKAPQLLLVGYLLAAVVHAVWDGAANNSVWWNSLMGVVAYALLGSALLKARQISPTREFNFAKTGDSVSSDVDLPGTADAQTPEVKPAGPVLKVGQLALPIREGALIYAGQIAGLAPMAGNGIVAMINRHPSDPSMLGLKNLSKTPWVWERPGKEARTVEPERSLHLVPGSRIRFGQVDGEVA